MTIKYALDGTTRTATKVTLLGAAKGAAAAGLMPHTSRVGAWRDIPRGRR